MKIVTALPRKKLNASLNKINILAKERFKEEKLQKSKSNLTFALKSV